MAVNSSWSPFPFKNVPAPLSNVDPRYVNVTNSNDPRSFGSNETNRQWGLSGVSNNAQAGTNLDVTIRRFFTIDANTVARVDNKIEGIIK